MGTYLQCIRLQCIPVGIQNYSYHLSLNIVWLKHKNESLLLKTVDLFVINVSGLSDMVPYYSGYKVMAL